MLHDCPHNLFLVFLHLSITNSNHHCLVFQFFGFWPSKSYFVIEIPTNSLLATRISSYGVIRIYNHIPMTLFGDFFHHFGVFLYLFLIATSPKRIKIEIPLYIPKSRRSILLKISLEIKLRLCKLEFYK